MKQAEPFLHFAQDPRVFLTTTTITARRSGPLVGTTGRLRMKRSRTCQIAQ